MPESEGGDIPTTSASTSKPSTTSHRAAASTAANVVVSAGASARELARARRIARDAGASLAFTRVEELVEPGRVPPPALVVVGVQRHAGKLLAERAQATLRCPVLQVRNHGSGPYSQTVIATDLGSALGEMVAAGHLVAPQTRVLFLHAYENPFESMLHLHGAGKAAISHHRRERARASQGRVRAHMKRWGLGGGALRLERGAPRFVLRRVPRHALLVIHRGRSRLLHVFFGSVTHWALEETACDVLVV